MTYDVLIIGAGASGSYCAIHAAQHNLRIALIEQNKSIGNKIRVSGGGRCNLTNLYISPDAYHSSNPKFCHSALTRHSQWDFLNWCQNARLSVEEKTLGQLFCQQKSRGLIDALQHQLQHPQITLHTQSPVQALSYHPYTPTPYHITTPHHQLKARALVIASGGASFPKLGGSDLALQLAKQLKLPNHPFKPALVPLILSPPLSHLSGISTPVHASLPHSNSPSFRENLLITHKGLSGPAILQLSTYWQKNQAIALNFLPDQPHNSLIHAKTTHPQQTLQQHLKPYLPHNLLIHLLNTSPLAQKIHQPLQHLSTTDLQHLQIHLQQWQITPTNTEGMNKAEVSSGGIDTRQFNPRTFENKTHKNLYAIGEALDVTGWLGGYNFQWAWSSAWCCAQALGKNLQS